MAAKIVSALVTLILLLALAVVVFAFMIIIMNGFSESDAKWGIYGYLGLSVLVTALMSAGAAVLAGRLMKKEMHIALVVFISSAVFTAIGATLICVSGFVGVVIADIVRKNF